MPIPRIVRQWNKAGLNRVTKHIAPWTPGLGVVIHRGRRSEHLDERVLYGVFGQQGKRQLAGQRRSQAALARSGGSRH